MSATAKGDSAALAQSNVDMIEACLNTPPDEHVMECDEEWFGWVEALGERPGMYLGMRAFGPSLAFISAIQSWGYWSFASVRAEVDAVIDAGQYGSTEAQA